MAGTKRADRHRAAHAATAPARAGEAEAEVPPPARVHRSRLAFAMSVTLAALPILALDNFPATADTGERTSVEAAAGADNPEADLRVVRVAVEPVTEAPPPPTEPVTPPTDDAVEVAAASEPVATPAPEPATTQRASAPAAPVRPAPAPTTTTAPPPPSSTTAAPSSAGDPNDPATWDRLARCESGGRWSLNSGNGYYGGLQFSLATWRDVGGTGYPHEATREEQIKRGKMLQARYGWGQWPYCSRELGYR